MKLKSQKNKFLITFLIIFILALLLIIGILTYILIPINKTQTPSDNNKQKINCLPEQRLSDYCIEIYKPVCGYRQVQCVTTPCNPVPETFSNSCTACSDDMILFYTEGEC